VPFFLEPDYPEDDSFQETNEVAARSSLSWHEQALHSRGIPAGTRWVAGGGGAGRVGGVCAHACVWPYLSMRPLDGVVGAGEALAQVGWEGGLRAAEEPAPAQGAR
jgi:hypothetical protein